MKCIILVEVINKIKTEFKDKERHWYLNARRFRKGSTPSEIQANQQKIEQKRKGNKISPK